jgi:hypothetical protein
LAILVAYSPWAAAALVDVGVQRARDGDIVIEASTVLRSDVATTWRVLTDYERYADFIPGLRSSRVVSREGAHLTVAQSGDASAGLVHVPLDVTYEITEFPPYALRSDATTSLLRAFESRYVLTPTAAGVRLDYTGRVTARPAFAGRFEAFVMQRNVVREFQALADEIERTAAAGN